LGFRYTESTKSLEGLFTKAHRLSERQCENNARDRHTAVPFFDVTVDPDSLQISSAIVANKGVCIEYRRKNGGMGSGLAKRTKT
jgi:hypothetical protein